MRGAAGDYREILIPVYNPRHAGASRQTCSGHVSVRGSTAQGHGLARESLQLKAARPSTPAGRPGRPTLPCLALAPLTPYALLMMAATVVVVGIITHYY